MHFYSFTTAVLLLWIELLPLCSAVATDCPVLEGRGTLSSDDVSSRLDTLHRLVLKHVRVEGDLNLEQEVDEFTTEDVVFAGRVTVHSTQGALSFTNSQFLRPLDLYLSGVKRLEFFNCVFEEDANFHSVKTEEFWLNNSVFRGHAVFVAMKVKSLLNLADVKFEKSVDFAGAVIGELNETRVRTNQPIEIRWEQFGETWLHSSLSWATAVDKEDRRSRLEQVELRLRFWQRNFLALGYKTDALEASYQIVNLRTKYFLTPARAEWWAALFLGLPNRYGTRPYRPLWVSLGVILLYAAIYYLSDPFVSQEGKSHYPKTPLLMFSLLFSIDTFVPLIAISGVKEWGWYVSDGFRWVVLSERVLGLALGGLAAYSIGSYVF